MPKYSVARSIHIDSDPNSVFDKVSDFSTWTTWSPWLCAEPDAKVTVSENSNSVGSSYAWEGEITGSGELEHLRLEPGRFIEDEIRFLKPWKSISKVGFQFEPAQNGTKVTWTMDGSLPWFMFWMLPMMEPFIGMDYDRGLAMMKEWIETGKIRSETQNKGVVKVGPLRMAGVHRTCEFKKIPENMAVDYEKCTALFEKNGLPTDKGMMAVYHRFNIKKQIMEYTCGYMVDGPVDLPELNEWEIGTAQALRVDHIGSYDHLGNGWSAANQIVRYKKLKQSKAGTFEIYRNTPADTPPEELVTEIYLPLK